MTDESFTPSGMRLCWDDKDCPRESCDGDLQQQDRFNVMCLNCERVWVHYKDETAHYLTDQYGENVAEKPRVGNDGGSFHTVSLSGPMRLRVRMTDSQLDQLHGGGMVEWDEICEHEPMGDADEWDFEVVE